MVDCAAPNCTGNSKKTDRFFNFPNDTERCKRWLVYCRRNFSLCTKLSELCEVSANINGLDMFEVKTLTPE